jgi:hypothetical protein
MGTGIPSDAKKTKQFVKTTDGKGFDFELYAKAVSEFFNDFFGKKIPYFFSNLGTVFRDMPEWWKNTSQDEQIAYAFLFLGFFMIITGAVLWIVL